jgi:inner membrane protein
MHREGHYGAALVAYAPLGFVTAVLGFGDLAVGGAVLAVALAVLPDYDQRVPGITHRGVTHTLWFALVVGAALGGAGLLLGENAGPGVDPLLGAFGFSVGVVTVCSHVAADALTPMGVHPFAPLDDRHVSFRVTKASNPVANYALFLLGVVVVGAAGLLAVEFGA